MPDPHPDSSAYPPNVVIHLPHDSRLIPAHVRDQFVLDDTELEKEIIRITDHLTYDLFGGSQQGARLVAAPVSRLVVDVERFDRDELEPMAAKGMGAVYALTTSGRRLRRDLTLFEREALMASYYRPHHREFESAVDEALHLCGSCLVIDAHSFPSRPLPYELDQDRDRPDICIGTDSSHTPDVCACAFREAFEALGFSVAVNRPFAGAIVPMKHYRADPRVKSLMVEVNRRLYLDESTGQGNNNYLRMARIVQESCRKAAWSMYEGRRGPQ